jgi:hypothetical protein
MKKTLVLLFVLIFVLPTQILSFDLVDKDKIIQDLVKMATPDMAKRVLQSLPRETLQALKEEIKKEILQELRATKANPVSVVVTPAIPEPTAPQWDNNLFIIVHADNPISEISMGDLKKIWCGHIDNWKECGGTDKAIKMVVAGSQWQKIRHLMPTPSNNVSSTRFNSAVVGLVGNNLNVVGIIGYDNNEQRDYLVSLTAIKIIPVSSLKVAATSIY